MRATHGRVDSPIGDICRSCTERAGCLGTIAGRNDSFELIFEFLEFAQDFAELSLPFLLLDASLADCEHPFAVDEVARAGPTRVFAANALPVLLEVGLDVLEAVESRHLTGLLLACVAMIHFTLSASHSLRRGLHGLMGRSSLAP